MSGKSLPDHYYGAQNYPHMVDFNGTLYTYAQNLQGDIVGILDANGVFVVEYKYDAWGRKLAVTGSLAATLGALNPFRYRGYVYDDETGMYFIPNRIYVAEWCRFLVSDDAFVFLDTDDDYETKNLYAYCDNNPLTRKDEDGNWWQLIGAAIGGLVSGGMELASQLISGTSIEDVNWKKVGVATASGAVSGFIASTGIGLVGQMGLNAAIGAASYAADESMNGGEITGDKLLSNATAGLISGFIGGSGANAKGMQVAWKAANKGITRELRRKNVEYAAKQIARYTATKTAMKVSITVSVARYTVGGYAARRYVGWRESLQ